jgi:Fur family ferric uptake transcriptional regulator
MAVIEAAQGPLTIGDIHLRAAQRLPRLGVATVYRTVKLLLEASEIHAVVLPDGQARYESARLDHHHHFRCNGCQLIFDLPGCMMPIPDGTALPNGFVVEGHEITLFGRCPNCRPRR